MKDYNFFWQRLDEAFFENPNKLFNADFKETARGWVSPYHLLTDKHTAKDGNGTVILRNSPYILHDGGDFSIREHYATDGGRTPKEVAEKYGVLYNGDTDAEAHYKRANAASLDTIAATAARRLQGLPADDFRKAYAAERFTPDEITNYEVGVFAPDDITKLQSLAPNAMLTETGAPKFANIPASYIIIPRRTSGRVTGFICRCAKANAAPADRYRNIALYNETDGKPLFNLPPAYARDKEDTRLVVVEGEISAIKIESKTGFSTVGTGGHSMTEKQAQAIARAGYTDVIIITDNDGTQRKDEWIKCTGASVKAAHAAGLTAYAVCIPDDADNANKKIGADDYITQLKGVLGKKIVHDARIAARVLFAEQTKGYTPAATDGERHAYLRDTARIMQEYCRNAVERTEVLKDAKDVFGKDVANALAEAEQAATKENNRKKAATLFKAVAAALETGDEEKAEKLRAKAIALLNSEEEEEKEEEDARPNLPQDFTALMKAIAGQVFIPTPYYAYSLRKGEDGQRKRAQLKIPAGAITVIAARTGHAKTKLLENIALQILNKHLKEDEQVLFFTAEEAAGAIVEQLVNIELNDNMIAENPLETIAAYLEHGDASLISADDEEDRNATAARIKAAFEKVAAYGLSGQLSVFENLDIDEIVAETKRAQRENGKKIKAIFVDYIQLLNVDGYGAETKAKIAEVCKRLIKLAKNTGAALIIASQLNRTVLDPTCLTINAIADASNIEHAASLVILQWNSDEKPFAGSEWEKNIDSNEISRELLAQDFEPGTAGKIAYVMAKNRKGERNLWGILDFNGATGKLSNYEWIF